MNKKLYDLKFNNKFKYLIKVFIIKKTYFILY